MIPFNELNNTSAPIGLFWKLTYDTDHVGYLLGTIHETPNRLNHFNEKIESAFNKCKTIAFEILGSPQVYKACEDKEIDFQIQEIIILNDQQAQKLRSFFEKLVGSMGIQNDYLNEKCSDLSYILSALIILTPYFKKDIAQKLEITSGHEFKLAEKAYEKKKHLEPLETLDKHLLRASKRVFLDRKFLAELAEAGTFDAMHELLQKKIDAHLDLQRTYFTIWEKGDFEMLKEIEKNTVDSKMMKICDHEIADNVDKLVRNGSFPFCNIGMSHAPRVLSILREYGYLVEQIL